MKLTENVPMQGPADEFEPKNSMKNYIGFKLIKATPMSMGEWNQTKGVMFGSVFHGSALAEGYLVEYPDGYQSWSPKEQFEIAYFPLTEDSKIVEEDVLRFMGEIESQQVDEKTTLVKCKSLTGFVQYETSSCVDPKNYSEELGKMYGTKNLVSKYWHNLGFVLQWAKNGLK